jgi:hypothetical protein
VATVIGACISMPLVARAPVQPPEATQLVESSEDQFRLTLPLLATMLGVAVMVTVGLGAMMTLADAAPVPPGPVHVSVYAVPMVMVAWSCVPLVARDPDHAPEAVQAVASVVDQVSVAAAPLATRSGSGVRVTTGGAAACAIATLADAAAVPPPTPLQLSVKLVAVVRPVMVSVPFGPRPPLQPPEAVQAEAAAEAEVLLDDQDSVVLPPLMTVEGVAVSMTVGANMTATLAVAAAVPPGPVHVSVNADAAVSAVITSLPIVGRAPDQLPEATQLAAVVVDHINVVDPPLAIVVGAAVMVTVGGGATAMFAVAAAMPPVPLQVSV